MQETQTKDCPSCKAKLGWFEKRFIRGVQYFNPDGTDSHFADQSGESGKRKYCYDCNRDITNCITEHESA